MLIITHSYWVSFREELEVTLKRERRMAEKSLARSKKMVCFNCRQPGEITLLQRKYHHKDKCVARKCNPGHMLADCPGAIENGGQVDAPNAGQCYKCGSLEHSSRYFLFFISTVCWLKGWGNLSVRDCKSKLKRENAYRFAVCFICKEEGHLAKVWQFR